MENKRPEFPIGVGVIVLDGNRVLMGQRGRGFGKGSWQVPSGHLEKGESLIACGKRELQEEAGLIADKLEFISVINDPRANGHYLHIVLLAKKWHGTVENREPEKCLGWQWFDLKNIPENIFIGHRKFIPALLGHEIFIDVEPEKI